MTFVSHDTTPSLLHSVISNSVLDHLTHDVEVQGEAWGRTEFQVNLKLGLTPRRCLGGIGSPVRLREW